MKSNIFLNDITVVDHAFIDHKGRVMGGSFHPSFIVEGSVDDVEKVVVDFSTIKKEIKYQIDKHLHNIDRNGFDHKLWIIEGFSNAEMELLDNDGDRYKIVTPLCTLNLPADAIKFISKLNEHPLHTTGYTAEYIGLAFEQFLEEQLSGVYSNIDIKVKCFNDINMHRIRRTEPYDIFSYSHGLKDSTSYGCQNIAHGHLSFFQHKEWSVVEEVVDDLDGAIFINKENIIEENDNEIQIKYESQRGLFMATYSKQGNKIIVLDTETTIEYIAEYIKSKYNVHDFFVSEGLSKGAYVA